MTAAADSRRRFWIRATLVAGIVLSALALFAVWGGRSARLAKDTPALSRIVVRVILRGVPRSGLPRQARILLRIRPLDADSADPHGLGAAEIVALMNNLGAPGSGPTDIPRGEFGYAVSLAQARAGILVPRAGRYHVHWGLIDLHARTWYSLGDSCGRQLDVKDETEPQTFALVMTVAELQRTLDGLVEGVRKAHPK